MLCSWDLNEHFPSAVQSPSWLAQCPEGSFVLSLTWAGTSWLYLPAQDPASQSRESGSSLMGSLLCAISLLLLEAARRVETHPPGLGGVRWLAPTGADGKALVNDKGPLPEDTHSHRTAQVGWPVCNPRTASQLALWLRGAWAIG